MASNKGGVGKTFVSTNLAVYLRALHEDLPVSLIGLDDQIGIDRMFSIGGRDADAPNLKHVFAERDLDAAMRLGQYGIRFVPSPPDTGPLKSRARDPRTLRSMIDRSEVGGLYLLDCKSDLEELTQSALVAADAVIVPITDQASLDEGEKIFSYLERSAGRPNRARALLSLVDRRTRVDRAGRDLHDRLAAEVDARGWSRFATHLSRSPRAEALQSGDARPRPILHEGKGTAVHRQLRELAEEVTKWLGLEAMAQGATSPAEPPSPKPRERAAVKRSLLGRWIG